MHLVTSKNDKDYRVGPRVKPPESTWVTEGITFGPIDFLFPAIIIVITTYLAIMYYDRWFDIVLY